MHRRPATHADMTIGATVYRGNGKVAQRVIWVGEFPNGIPAYGTCKAATVKDPTRFCVFAVKNFTVED